MQEPQLLQKAIKWIDGAVVPQVTRHAISGAAMIRTWVSRSPPDHLLVDFCLLLNLSS